MIKSKKDSRKKVRYAIRNKVFGTSEQPRLAVFRSNKQIYAQLIDDVNGVVQTILNILDVCASFQRGIIPARIKLER